MVGDFVLAFYMTVGVFGEMGHGKTVFMTALVTTLSETFREKIYANYLIRNENFVKLETRQQLNEIRRGFVAFTEMSEDADSRRFKDNGFITSWVNQSRKRSVVLFYDTQSSDQVDKRLRQRTDYAFYCEKMSNGFRITFWNFRTLRLLRTYRIKSFRPWFGLYDTEEIVSFLK